MGKFQNILKLLCQLLILGGGVVLLILAFSRFSNFQADQIAPGNLQPDYPPPLKANSTPTQSGYPAPKPTQTQIIYSTPTITPTPTINPYLFSSPAEATKYFAYIKRTPSPSEVAAEATYWAMRVSMATEVSAANKNSTPYQQPSYPVKTDADLPKVLYNDLGFFNSFPCFSAKNPAPALFVKSLDPNKPDFYLVPFYKNNQLCSLVEIDVDNGYGVVSGAIGDLDNSHYSILTANDAIGLVEAKSGQKVVNTPILVFQQLREAANPLDPFWQVKTTEGQTYYVVILARQSGDGSFKENAIILNAKDTTIIREYSK